MKCPNCEKNVSKHSEECKYCGYPIKYMVSHSQRLNKEVSHAERPIQEDTFEQIELPMKEETMARANPKTQSKSEKKKKGPAAIFSKVIFWLVIVSVFGRGNLEGIFDIFQNGFDEVESEYKVSDETNKGIDHTETGVEDYLLDQEALLKDIDIWSYTYEDSIGNVYTLLDIYNDTGYDINCSVELEILNESGEAIDMKYGTIQAFSDESTYLMPFLMDGYDAFNIYMTIESSSPYEVVDWDLYVTQEKEGTKEVVTVENTGDLNAQYVEVKVLFFLDDEVVNYSSQYFTDDAYELKAGEIMTKTFDAYTAYDYALVYVHGSWQE